MSEYQDYGYATAEGTHAHKYLLEPLLELLAGNKERRIIDIGCGNGWLTSHLIDQGYDAYGTDASPSGIEIARQKHPGRFYIQDLSKDDLPEELSNLNFNTVISTEVIEHLYAPRQYFDFCKRILQRSGGGELIVSTPYHGYLKNIVLAVTGKMDQHFTVLWDGGHIKFWSKKTLEAVLHENGFTQFKFRGCGRMPYLWKSMMVSSRI